VTLELCVVSGARAGATERFDKPVVTVGRHATSDLRFDPQSDLDVSTRHAELRRTGDAWSVRDLGSTNGTFVNGERVTADRRLTTGDVVGFGANGPTVEVRTAAIPATTAATASTAAGPLRRAALIGAGALVVLAVTAGVVLQRDHSLRGNRLPAPPTPAPARDVPASVPAADFSAVRDRNDAAVAMIASDLDGTFMAGTAFGVDSSGVLVTNRHVVQGTPGTPARRIRVIYANTTDWLPARIERVSATDDLALIRLERPGTYPIVSGTSRASAPVRAGAPIVTIGYPLAVETPMEGEGLHVTARTTTTAGTIAKQLDDVLQIDAYAGKGSSGSPVFDASGQLVGVVYGGAPESNGRIVYAVPSARLARFLRH
jgi:S1-C subfamily serine protease